MELIHKNIPDGDRPLATHKIPDAQSLAITKAIISKLGIPSDSPALRDGISFDSNGRVTVAFHIPPAELEAIINESARGSRG